MGSRRRHEPGYRGLALAVIGLAVRDIHKCNGHADGAVEFLRSAWGQRLAIELDLDNVIREWLHHTLGEQQDEQN